jgi:hypothetical protein
VPSIDPVAELNKVIAEILRLGDRIYNERATAADHARLAELEARYKELQPLVEA